MSDVPSLAELDAALPFVDRHIGLRPADIDTMLERLGFDSLDALMAAAVPGGIRSAASLALPEPVSEAVAARELREIEGTLAELPSERTAEEAPAASASDELAARRAARNVG